MELKFQNSDIDIRARCYHCGEYTDNKDGLLNNNRLYCCSGCFAASSLIHSLGLEEYYDIKNYEKHISGESPDTVKYADKEDYSYLNQENFIDLYTTEQDRKTLNFYIEGIQCTGCLWLIENLSKISNEIESVELNMSSNVAAVKVKNDFSVFPSLVSSLGYRPHPVKPGSATKDIELMEGKKLLYRIGVAGFCAGNIMLLSAAIYSGADSIFKELFQIIASVLLLPVVTYCAYPFYLNVLNSLRYRKADVDIAVVFIIVSGTLLSTVNLYMGGETYFDSISAFVFLLLLSRYVLKYLQNILVRKSSKNGTLFKELKVLKWDPDAGQYFLSPVGDVKKGEKVRFNRGDTIPYDGICQTRNVYLDVSVLTGENYPKNIRSGENVYAGSRLESDILTIIVKNSGFETRIGKILKKIEDGSFINKNLSIFTDRYSTLFTFTVAVIALTFLSFTSFSLGFSHSLTRTISFVLVSCPCAFIFVLPLTYSFSIKSGFEKGFIIRDLSFFDKVKRIKNIFFDKTGTLTNGRFRILDWDYNSLSDYDLSAVLSIQSHSGHPIAEAISRHLSLRNLVLQDAGEYGPIPGKGYYGTVHADRYEFINEPISNINEVNQFLLTRINVFKNGEKISEILFGDNLRDDAKLTASLIKSMGIKTFIISGDRKVNVLKTASKLGIYEEDCFSEQTPEDKIIRMEKYPNSVMVGDGLNDSGALAKADIGIAMQGSVEQNLGASDIYLINKNLISIVDLIKHGNATSEIIKITIITSLIYNITTGTLALFGFITPLAAAVLMPSSSFLLLSISYLGHKRLRGIKKC